MSKGIRQQKDELDNQPIGTSLPANCPMYMIRSHGEPGYTDSEGLKYVKTYDGGRWLTWTYSALRAKRLTHAEAREVQRLLKEAQTDSEVVPAPAETDCSTPVSGKPVNVLRLRTVTDDDWTIRPGKSGKFYISRTSDGLFLAGVIVQADSVGYVWAETEEEAREFDSLAAASDYASEMLLLQTCRDELQLETHGSRESQMPVNIGPKVGRNDACPCGSGNKWKKCCMGAK